MVETLLGYLGRCLVAIEECLAGDLSNGHALLMVRDLIPLVESISNASPTVPELRAERDRYKAALIKIRSLGAESYINDIVNEALGDEA